VGKNNTFWPISSRLGSSGQSSQFYSIFWEEESLVDGDAQRTLGEEKTFPGGGTGGL